MNYKILVIFFGGLILSFIIFIFTFDNKQDYVALGDELVLGITPYSEYNESYSDFFSTYLSNKNKLKSYIEEFAEVDYHITDLISDIKLGKVKQINNKELNVTQAIAKADIITISLGQKEIKDMLAANYKNGQFRNKQNIYKYIDQLFDDYVELLNLIRKINDCDIYIVGLYNPIINAGQSDIAVIEDIFNYINTKFSRLEKDNKNIYYINLSSKIDSKSYYIPRSEMPYPSIEGYNFISNEIICKVEKKCWYKLLFILTSCIISFEEISMAKMFVMAGRKIWRRVYILN